MPGEHEVEPIGIHGAWLFTPRIFRDSRGSFLEWFRSDDLSRCLGYQPDFAQANCSVSHRGVIRGIHFSDVPPGQAKYVTCVRGAITDVIVDIRLGSPTYGQWKAVRLDDVGRRAVFIAEGLGHAFMALTDDATLMYLCSTPYAPAREHGIHPLDPGIAIAWPNAAVPMLSGKDAAAPSLEQARRSGLLPAYGDCLAYAQERRGVLGLLTELSRSAPTARSAATRAGKAWSRASRQSRIGATPARAQRSWPSTL